MCEYTDVYASIDYGMWCMLNAAIQQTCGRRVAADMFTLWHLSGSLGVRGLGALEASAGERAASAMRQKTQTNTRTHAHTCAETDATRNVKI